MDALVDFLFTKVGAMLGTIVLVLALGFGYYFEYGTEQTVTFTVTGLTDQAKGTGHQYLVFTTRPGKGIEVFKDADAFWHGKHDSSDVWARFVNAGKGAVWRCTVYGWRVFISSSYRDILDGCALLKQGNPSALPAL